MLVCPRYDDHESKFVAPQEAEIQARKTARDRKRNEEKGALLLQRRCGCPSWSC